MISKEEMRILYQLASQDVIKEMERNGGDAVKTLWMSLQELYTIDSGVAQAALAMIILCTSVHRDKLPGGLLEFLLSAHPEVKT